VRPLDVATAICLVLGAVGAHAQAPLEAPDLPPTAMVEKILQSQPSVLAARAELGADEANRVRLRVGGYESTVRVNGQRRRADDPSSRYGEWDVGVERTIRLPDKAQIDAQLGDRLVERGRSAYGDAMHEAARGLLHGWFVWLRENAQLRQWQAQVEVLREQLGVVEKRVRAGDAAKLEASQATAALDQADAQLALARARERMAATELAHRYVGIELPTAQVTVGPPPLEQSLEFWRERSLQESHELMLARHESARAQLTARRADADLRPDPTVGVRYASERSGGERVVGLSLAIPLPGQGRSALADAAGSMSQAASQREAAILRKLEAEIAGQHAQAVATRESWQRFQRVADRVEQNAGLLSRAYALGETPLGELLTARRQAIEARLAATIAQFDAAEARYRMMLDAHLIWDFD
jgi:outer membrane protein TolC